MGIDHVATFLGALCLEAGVSTQLAKTRPSDFIANLTITMVNALQHLERFHMERVALGLRHQQLAMVQKWRADPFSRALVACLALDHVLCSAASVARHFGKAKATLSEQMTEPRRRPADQAILARTPR